MAFVGEGAAGEDACEAGDIVVLGGEGDDIIASESISKTKQ